MAISSTLRGLTTLGLRIIEERERLSWTREEMAGHGKVSRASQRLYESCDRMPPLTYFLHLANAGADFNYLFHGDRAETIAQQDEQISISWESLTKAFQLVWHASQAEKNGINSAEDAEELFISILKQLQIADTPGFDLSMLAKATMRDEF